ncbi:MAG: hypothetical protein H0X16_01560 [Chloroflexi bacterium]|nr:hypothetical protein [Chloroflexota bacterium]
MQIVITLVARTGAVLSQRHTPAGLLLLVGGLLAFGVGGSIPGLGLTPDGWLSPLPFRWAT